MCSIVLHNIHVRDIGRESAGLVLLPFLKEALLGHFSSLREQCHYKMKFGILWKSQTY